MTESVDLREIGRRPTRYWNVDGLPEMVMGALWMVWGGSWLYGQTLEAGPVRTAFWLAVPALLALSGVGATWLTKRLKERITFPRTGYVEWKEPTRVQRLGAAGVALVSAAVLAAVVARGRMHGMEQVTAPAMGVLLSLALLVASLRQSAPHLLALAGVALALGLALGALATGWEAANWLFVGLGAASVVAGGLRLRKFLRQNPREQAE